MKDIEYQIAKLSLSPGDVLVLKLDQHITQVTHKLLIEMVQPFVPHNKVLVVEPGAELSVIESVTVQ